MAQEKKKELPSEEVQAITDADDGYRNCGVCGLWLEEGNYHSHEDKPSNN